MSDKHLVSLIVTKSEKKIHGLVTVSNTIGIGVSGALALDTGNAFLGVSEGTVRTFVTSEANDASPNVYCNSMSQTGLPQIRGEVKRLPSTSVSRGTICTEDISIRVKNAGSVLWTRTLLTVFCRPGQRISIEAPRAPLARVSSSVVVADTSS